MGVSSLIYAQLATRKPPSFTGEESDWHEFARDWTEFLAALRESEGREVSDILLFGVLEACLDPATSHKLKAERERDPSLTFSGFWKKLEREFGRDYEDMRRREWERVALKPGELTLSSWRAYRVAVEAALTNIAGITSREMDSKLVRDLPVPAREKLVRECARKVHEKF